MPKEPISNFLGLGENMPRLNLYLAGAAVIMGVAVWALLRFSRFGLATRAADENEKGASLLGYSPQRLAGLNWVLSAVLAGIVGCSSSAAARSTRPGYTQLVIPALGAALLGGLTSIPLATIGGLALGMFQAGMVELTERSWWPEWLPAAGVRELDPARRHRRLPVPARRSASRPWHRRATPAATSARTSPRAGRRRHPCGASPSCCR